MQVDLNNLESVLAQLPGGGCASRASRRPFAVEQDDAYVQAHKKVERLLVVRDRSVQELRERLLADGFEEAVVELLLERCVASGLVDDDRFAQTLIRSRISARWGVEGIRRDLEKHGIDPACVQDVLDESLASAPPQYEQALALLRSKPCHAKDRYRSAFGRLVRKGYSASVAHRATLAWIQEQG